MSSILHQCKNRLHCSNISIESELKNILDKLVNENRLLKNRFNRLDEKYQKWIDDERVCLLNRIEKLTNENHQLLEIYQTYQIQNEKTIRSITNLILKILLTQQELRKQYTERQNDVVQCRKKRQQDESITRNTRSISCHVVSNQLNDSRYTINDQSIWVHQVKEQDQKTRDYSSELNNHSSTLATTKSKTDKSSSALSNKLYDVLNNEETPSKSTGDNHRSTGINITPVDNSNIIPHRKQQSSITINKNQPQTRSTYSNHERLSTQTPCRTSPIVKKATTPSVSKPPRVPTITIRSPTPNIRQHPPPPSTTNQKTVSTTNKSPRPRCTLPKSSEPIRSTPPRSRQTITNKPSISPTKNIKTRVPIISQQPARVTDLDAVIAEQQKQNTIKLPAKPTIISPSSLIKPSLFSKDTVKLVRPVHSQELKIFSYHLIPEISIETNESLSTLTPSSFQSIEKQNVYSNNSGVVQDFSEDSLNEKCHNQTLINPTKNDNLQDHSTIDDNFNSPYALLSSLLIKPKSVSSLVHRLVFPERLGRLIFYRRVLSDSDIYQKICSKDNEIFHNVYHLDTIRDYSMEFYMLTTYASDSQLRAWLDNDDEIVDHFNENRFQLSDEEIKRINSSDSLIQEEELDWYSELELFNSTKENTSSNSSEIRIGEFLPVQQTSTDSSNSTDLNSISWTLPAGGSNQAYSTPLPSDITDQSNSILQEILNHSWTDNLSTTNSIQHETGIEQFENDSTSSIITDEFQSDFYYLCPITKTTSFSKIDYKT